MSHNYNAAKQSILDFTATPSSRYGEDALLQGDYYDIINNALDLERNSPVARSIVQCLEDYVAGNGLTPTLGHEKGLEVWRNWAYNPVDISGTKSFKQVFRDVVKNIAASGDVLLTTPIDKRVGNDAIALRLELTSGARILTPEDLKKKKDEFGNVIKFGVAFKDGVEVGYYVQNENSNMPFALRRKKANFRYIEKYDSRTGRLNAILIRRPTGMPAEQTRGLSILTPVVQTIKDMDDLLVSAIQGSRNKALLSVILETADPTSTYGGAGAINEDGQLIEANSDSGETQIIGELPDGAIMTVPAGTKANAINSSGDIDRDALILRTQRLQGAGVGIPYEILFKDFSQTNFSSGKLGFDSFFRLTEFWTGELITVFQQIYKLIQLEATLKGFGIENPKPIDYVVEFIGSQNYVDADPGKNSKAETERQNNGTATATRSNLFG